MKNSPQVGALLGEGCFAQVFEDPEDARYVLKRTTCTATIALLRNLVGNPEPGLPRVEAEVHPESSGAVWFRLERLYALTRPAPELTNVSHALRAVYSYASKVASEERAEYRLVRKFAFELRLRGERRLSQGAAYLSKFLQANPVGALDLHTSSNLMRDQSGRVVLSDPIAETD